MLLSRRSLGRSLAQLRRDASMIVAGLTGRKAPPFSARLRPVTRPEVHVERATVLHPRTVRVAGVVRETADAVTLVLEDPTGAAFHFAPGQFFTLLVPIGDETLRRAYSACSDVRDTARVSIAVKRVAGGVVSNHVNDHVREGDLLQVLGPSGSFVLEPAAAASARHVVLLAGGSGITPMMAILRATLASSASSRVTLVYGNRGRADVMFHDALADLARAHEGRLTVRHVLSDPPSGWTGSAGVLEEKIVAAELEACSLDGDARYFICGPEPMMRAARAALRARGVADDHVLEERFTQPHLRAKSKAALEAGPQLLTIRANGAGVREVYVGSHQTVLEAGLSSGISMDYSCAMGGCAACKVRVCDGEVEMEEPNCLTAEERAGGYVLACVSRLKKPTTIALQSDASYAPGARK